MRYFIIINHQAASDNYRVNGSGLINSCDVQETRIISSKYEAHMLANRGISVDLLQHYVATCNRGAGGGRCPRNMKGGKWGRRRGRGGGEGEGKK